MICNHVSTCTLFPMFSMKSSLALWRSSYCEGDFTRCERKRLAELNRPVPANLLPNGKLLGKLPEP